MRLKWGYIFVANDVDLKQNSEYLNYMPEEEKSSYLSWRAKLHVGPPVGKGDHC